MRTTRTFIAIPVPEPLAAKLTRLQTLLAPEIPGARWSEISPFHLTLAFLGDVEDTDLHTICEAVEETAASFPPISLILERLGAFPDAEQARVLWVGLSGSELPVLHAIQAHLADACARLKYPCDSRFHPHVTVARLKRKREGSPDLTAQLNHFRTWAAGSLKVKELVTYSSSLSPEGPIYTPLARATLSGKKSRA